jgi:DHA2 family multidrug resistance protein
MVLSPGGFAIIATLPLIGILSQRVQARWMIGAGFAISAIALFHMCGLNLQIDFTTVMMYRIYQSIGLPFLFIPINVAAFASATGQNSNQISSIVNLCRNVGGSVGISLVATLIARHSQLHQDALAKHVTLYDGTLRHLQESLSSSLSRAGASSPDAMHQALGRIYGFVQVQAAAQAYIDTLWLLALACLCMLPLVLLMDKNDPSKAMAAH